MRTIQFLDLAEEEMIESARYYENQLPGLGARFLDEVERMANAIAEFPEAGHDFEDGLHRRLLLGFPFGLLYRIEPDGILITAVMHLHRRPEYWVDRQQQDKP